MAVGARKVHRGSLNNAIPASYCCILSCLQGSQKTALRLTGSLKTWTIAPFSQKNEIYRFCLDIFSDVLCNNSPTISTKSALLMCDYRNIFGVSVRHLKKTLLCSVLMSFSAAFCLNRGWTGWGRTLGSDMTACDGRTGTTMKQSGEICPDLVGPRADTSQRRCAGRCVSFRLCRGRIRTCPESAFKRSFVVVQFSSAAIIKSVLFSSGLNHKNSAH